MSSEAQESFDRAFEAARTELPEAFSEKGRRALIASGLGSLAIFQVITYSTDMPYDVQLIAGASAYAIGTVGDRISTYKILRKNQSMKKEGIDSPYHETNPLINPTTPEDFIKSKWAFAIDSLFALTTVLSPPAGFAYGVAKTVMTHNNMCKVKRLNYATDRMHS